MIEFPLVGWVLGNAPVSDVDTRVKIESMESFMRTQVPVEIPERDYFAHKTYAREITIPKDTILTGKIHNYSQINILSKGDISVLTEDGVKRMQAPFTIVSPPGTKRIAYAHEECVWTTLHGTDETDVAKIEAEFISQSNDQYLAFKALIEDKS